MHLFTEQPLVVWQLIKAKHCYHPNPDNLDVMAHLDQSFADAYDWLINQFNQRIPKPDQATIPIWWWLDNGVRTNEKRIARLTANQNQLNLIGRHNQSK